MRREVAGLVHHKPAITQAGRCSSQFMRDLGFPWELLGIDQFDVPEDLTAITRAPME